ncbi:hypothetical protein MSAS_28490 [Mycobacterium saskatchewanense]|nr:hypothetical protein MSAS_28490 [Mycobacterium saskatchewanense]
MAAEISSSAADTKFVVGAAAAAWARATIEPMPARSVVAAVMRSGAATKYDIQSLALLCSALTETGDVRTFPGSYIFVRQALNSKHRFVPMLKISFFKCQTVLRDDKH